MDQVHSILWKHFDGIGFYGRALEALIILKKNYDHSGFHGMVKMTCLIYVEVASIETHRRTKMLSVTLISVFVLMEIVSAQALQMCAFLEW